MTAVVTVAVAVAVTVAVALALALALMSLIKLTDTFHLASNGCNMWEMKLTEGLHMLWMHVDGSP